VLRIPSNLEKSLGNLFVPQTNVDIYIDPAEHLGVLSQSNELAIFEIRKVQRELSIVHRGLRWRSIVYEYTNRPGGADSEGSLQLFDRRARPSARGKKVARVL